MTPMYISGCYGVIPHPYVIVFIVKVLLSQTLDHSSYVYKWLP